MINKSLKGSLQGDQEATWRVQLDDQEKLNVSRLFFASEINALGRDTLGEVASSAAVSSEVIFFILA